MRLLALSATLALPLPALACLDGAPVRADLSADALMTAEVEGFRAAFEQEIAVLRSEDLPLDDAFAFGRCRLNGAEQPILLAFATGAPFCEEEACGVWGLERRPLGWEVVIAGTGDMSVAASSSMGRADLIFSEAGQPDVVHKFDGVQWRDTLEGLIYGEVFDLPDASGWQEDASGFVGLSKGEAGPNGEAVVALEALESARGVAPNAVIASLASLNGDGVPEIVIEGVTPELCAPEGCMTWIYAVEEGSARLLAEVTAQGAPEIAATSRDGWRDVIIWTDAGARVLLWQQEGYR